ncbi:MAG: NACHT domain-containing protein, partial [Limisphaerales bacterium]
MNEFPPRQNRVKDHADIRSKLLIEVRLVFQESLSPTMSDEEISRAISLLFELLECRIGDPNLDGIGEQILKCLTRRFCQGEKVRLADRFEPFAKFVLKMVDPERYKDRVSKLGNRFTLAEILKAHSLAEDNELKTWGNRSLQQFPPPGLPGTPFFKEQVAWTYRSRNTEEHTAPELNSVQEAKSFQSVCVCLVWLTAKLEKEIRSAITRMRFSGYLRKIIRGDLADIGIRFVELTTETRSPDEYLFLDPLSPPPSVQSPGMETDASRLPDVSRVTVIEAEPGAGKTTTLQFIAWQQATGLFSGKTGFSHIPLCLDLRLLAHRRQTIEAAVEHALTSARSSAEPIPWDLLLLLVDGMNEVSPRSQTAFKTELRQLLSEFSGMRAVVAGRPKWFRGEFKAQVVVLRKLTEPQLLKLFEQALGHAGKASDLLLFVQHSPFLSKWARTPLHAAMVAQIARHGGVEALASPSSAVRRFIRNFLGREDAQTPGQTQLLSKERLLARLAFVTKEAGQLVIAKARALMELGEANPTLDPQNFLQEVVDNHLLRYADRESLEFAHELYHDYFAATELETSEQVQAGLGVTTALAHFSDTHWSECLRVFSGLSNTSRTLIERGAEKNPFLAWQLIRDAGDEKPELLELVADEAYCALSADLKTTAEAAMGGACILVLADLGRADLLERAISRQSHCFEPSYRPKTTAGEGEVDSQSQLEIAFHLVLGLLHVVRLGLGEQAARKEGPYCQAARSLIRGLEQIRAARALMLILSQSSAGRFDELALIPGSVLSAIINLGVDQVLGFEHEAMNQTLAGWLKLASEAGFSKAWPAYGRVLRLAMLDDDREAALRWLRRAHETGDRKSTLELALLLLEEPNLGSEAGE